MNTSKTLKARVPQADTDIRQADGVDAARPAVNAASVTPTASRPLESAGYRPRSWRYPMGLFQALLPLDDRPVSATALRLGETGYGPRYGNRRAWARQFPGFGSTTAVDPECSTCNA